MSAPSVKPVRMGLLAGLVFLLICIIALVAFVLATNSQSSGKPDAAQTIEAVGHVANGVHDVEGVGADAAASHPVVHTYDLDASDLLAIPASTSIASIQLGDGATSQTPSGIDLSDVQSAVSAIQQNGECGFVFVDADTGKGLAYNAAEVLYVASVAKAPFVYWLLTSGVGLDEWELEEVQWIIEDSENEAFEDLFMRYYENSYANMMARYGIQHEDYHGDYYPKMSARSLAGLWADMYAYTQSGSEDGTLLGSLFTITTTSFIRDGVDDAGAIVMNKAGWIGEESSYYFGEDDYDGVVEYDSVSDAGIIMADGHTYLMVIVTSQPDSSVNEAKVSTLARALFDQRYNL